jgi:ferric-dicitrate binding protein FerR (iron transport regulator)
MPSDSHSLLHRYLNGDLDGRELEDFRSQLARNETLQRRLADLALDEALLSDAIREEAARAESPAGEPHARPAWPLNGKSLSASPAGRSSRRFWMGLGLAAGIAAFSVIAHRLLNRPVTAPAVDARWAWLDAADRAVELRPAGSDRWQPLPVGGALAVDDAVRTVDARARLALRSGSVIYIDNATRLVLRSRPYAPGLRLEAGSVYIQTDPRDAGLWVETPHGQAVSHGTRFCVSAHADRTTVVVAAGRVAFANAAGDACVTAGLSAQSSASDPPSVPEPVDAEALIAWHRSLSRTSLLSPSPDAEGAPLLVIPAAPPAGPGWSRGSSLYEADVRSASPEGTFAGLARRLPELKELGVGILCLLPIYPTGSFRPDPRLLADPGGSLLPVPEPHRVPMKGGLFCASDYRAVNPDLGTPDDLRRLVEEGHRLGLRLLVDFIPNQTSWDHVLTRERPDFYARSPEGRVLPNHPWMDVARLDYGNPALWEYMADTRRMWITAFGFDGFRETTAGATPAAHWAWLRPRLDAAGSVFLFADAEDPRHHPALDASYDWAFQAHLYMIVRGTWPAASLDRLLAEEADKYPRGAVRVRLLTNHDMIGGPYAHGSLAHLPEGEKPYVRQTPLETKYGGPGGHRVAAVLCATLPGSKPMLWNGQELGFLTCPPQPVPWGDRQNPWWRFYRTLLAVHRDNPALNEGDFARVRTEPDDAVYAFVRSKGDNRVMTVLNLSPRPQAVRLRSAHMAGRYMEAFDGVSRTLGADETLSLEPWEFHLFVRGTPR